MIKRIIFIFLLILVQISIFAQTHTSIPLGHPIYTVFEQAQMRGLYDRFPEVKPYSRDMVLSIIEEILFNESKRRFGKLTEAERNILYHFKHDFLPKRNGYHLTRGTFSIEHIWNNVYFSAELGLGLDMIFAGGYYPIAGGYKENDATHPAAGDSFGDIILLPYLTVTGDIGRNFTYGLSLAGYIGRSPRAVLGQYDITMGSEIENLQYVKSDPLAYFPYTYKKKWDGFLFAPGNLSVSGQLAWPDNFALGYHLMPEMTGSLFNGHVILRFSRMDREWAGMTNNGSLILNQTAQPFLAIEAIVRPFKWISFSALTGILEYDGEGEWDLSSKAYLKEKSSTFQNAFSIVMVEGNVLNYFYACFGSSVVWAKRFELGYIHPLTDNFTYQNNIGDFDNLALFLNLQGQYPGLGKIWVSGFLDEVNLKDIKRFFELDRMMYAFQIGASAFIPGLPFSSLTLSYTKIEPYNYTHTRTDVPWYRDGIGNRRSGMETNYVNFGRPLGSYLPPNSDELLIRFETIPIPGSLFRLQYQMIRHGADYGDRAVDGSSLWSELTGNRLEMTKFFLNDGAYQWSHIVRVRGEYSFARFKAPVRLIAEFGVVYSYFTDIEGEVNSVKGKHRIINTPQYPKTFSLIGSICIQICPKF